MTTDYEDLNTSLKAISEGIRHELSVLSNATALIYENMPDLNWCGFYISDGERLYLGPFQGKVACTEIEFGKGVCGTAYSRNETVLVKDVHSFDGHIACDSASNSEIVIPIHKNGEIYGVLDIDSPLPARFTEEDKEGLELIVKSLEEILK